jgi:hypothetical protein
MKAPETPWEGIGRRRGSGGRPQLLPASGPACLAIRFSVGCALIIPMVIQTILLDPSRPVWSDSASNVSRLDPSGADQADAEHPSRNRKVAGSGPAGPTRNRAWPDPDHPGLGAIRR